MSTTSLSKTLVVKNGLLLLAFHLPRLFGIIYLVIIGLWIKKGYQETDIGTGTVFTKVIGFADTTHRTDLENASRKVWDALDVVGEAQDDQSLFIMTNEISTIGQKRSVCPEDISVAEAHCTLKNRSMCVKGDSILLKGHGIMTGNCVPFPNSTNHTCEIQGWCPAEHSVFKSNTKADVTDEELISNCKENATNYWDCPIFNVSYILNEAGINDTRRDKIILQGGIIAVTIKWICDFDSDRDGKRCLPDYTFKQLKKETHNNHSVWYFRSVRYDSDKGVQTRDLFRKTGLFFIFNIDAKAGRYDTFTTLLSFGAITGYFRLGPAICIMIITISAWIPDRLLNNSSESQFFLFRKFREIKNWMVKKEWLQNAIRWFRKRKNQIYEFGKSLFEKMKGWIGNNEWLQNVILWFRTIKNWICEFGKILLKKTKNWIRNNEWLQNTMLWCGNIKNWILELGKSVFKKIEIGIGNHELLKTAIFVSLSIMLLVTMGLFIYLALNSNSALLHWIAWIILSFFCLIIILCILFCFPEEKLDAFFFPIDIVNGTVLVILLVLGLSLQSLLLFWLKVLDVSFRGLLIGILIVIIGDIITGLALGSIFSIGTVFWNFLKRIRNYYFKQERNDRALRNAFHTFLRYMSHLHEQLNENATEYEYVSDTTNNSNNSLLNNGESSINSTRDECGGSADTRKAEDKEPLLKTAKKSNYGAAEDVHHNQEY